METQHSLGHGRGFSRIGNRGTGHFDSADHQQPLLRFLAILGIVFAIVGLVGRFEREKRAVRA